MTFFCCSWFKDLFGVLMSVCIFWYVVFFLFESSLQLFLSVTSVSILTTIRIYSHVLFNLFGSFFFWLKYIVQGVWKIWSDHFICTSFNIVLIEMRETVDTCCSFIIISCNFQEFRNFFLNP